MTYRYKGTLYIISTYYAIYISCLAMKYIQNITYSSFESAPDSGSEDRINELQL